MNLRKPQILVTDYVLEPALERDILESHGYKVVTEQCAEFDAAEVIGLLVWHALVTPNYLERFPRLVAVVRYGVGVDNLALPHLGKAGIRVANTTDYGIDEVADHTIALALYGLRGLGHSRATIENLGDNSWQENVPSEVRRFSQTSFGVLGLGRIGTAVALKARALGLRVQFFDPYVSRGADKVLGVSRIESLEEFAGTSDVVSVHVNLTAETAGIVSPAFVESMPRGAGLINTSRGKTISDFSKLLGSLESHHLQFAALDVLPDEPLNRQSLAFEAAMNLVRQGRLLLTPHVGFYSKQSFAEMRVTASHTLLQLILGRKSPYELISHLDS